MIANDFLSQAVDRTPVAADPAPVLLDALGVSAGAAVLDDEGGRVAERDLEGDGQLRFRTIWISDLHLGTSGCQARLLLDFLRRTESDFLYLVGDIIDGWQLRRRWYWPQAHNDVVQKILRKARKGTRVVYIPGNHDEFGRHFLQLSFGGIEVRDEVMHVTADGRCMLVLHGDLFDAVVQRARWLSIAGDQLHTGVLHLNRWLNALRARLGFPYWSLAKYLKLKVKNAVSYIVDFECAVAAEARRRGAHGVVCGHIHKAEIRDIDGVLYCNDGDWVESLTALVESSDGTLRVLDWHQLAKPDAQEATAPSAAAPGAAVPTHPARQPEEMTLAYLAGE